MWIQCIFVGAVWGLTNALMKNADASYTVHDKGNAMINLIKNWRWILAFLANQSGSILFYMTLRDADLSVAVPVCQATTLLFNIIGAFLFGERFDGDPKCKLMREYFEF